MSFFDTLFQGFEREPRRVEVKDERDAITCLLLACSAADGDASGEAVQMVSFMANHRWVWGVEGEMYFIRRALGFLDAVGGPLALAEMAAPVVPVEIRESMMFYSVDMVLTDGYLKPEEKEILDIIKNGMGLSDEICKKIVEVAIMKNKIANWAP